MRARFADRRAAGRELGELLRGRGVHTDVVLGLPRGGVPVGAEVATVLGVALDVLVVRKLRVPGQPELAFGAVAGGGVRWLNDDVVDGTRLSTAEIDASTERELAEVRAREQRYGRGPLSIEGRAVTIVDDGIATGATVRAAVECARLLRASSIGVAAPIATPRIVTVLRTVADRVDVAEIRRHFGAVSVVYDDFREVPDEDVEALLRQ
jgi:predicted phosphoribosyltransferase